MRAGSAQNLDDSDLAPSLEEGSRWYGAAAMALAALLFAVRLGARALWASEGRWAEVVREMVLSGDYFWPTINGKLYYDKPLLSYWFIVGATYVTGGVNETAARLPSAIFGLAGVALVIVLARRLYDRTTAAWAGFILATSFSYVFFSRNASADIETTTGVLAALTLFVFHRERQDGWWVVWLWLVMAITSLTKGLIGLALPIAVMGLYSLLEEGPAHLYQRISAGTLGSRWSWLRQRLQWLLNWKTPAAVLIAGAVYYLPFALSHRQAHSDAGLYMVFRENIVRALEPFDHRGPVYLYIYVFFALMAPWSLFIPAALLEMHRKARNASARALSGADLFALVYFWGTFAFFTLSRSRRSYYLLPILPAAAILIARLFTERSLSGGPWVRRLTTVAYGLIAAAAIGFGIGFLMPAGMRPGWLSLLPPSPARAVFLAGWLIALATIWYACRDLTVRRIAASCAIITYLALWFLFIVLMPQAEIYRYERSFARAVRADVGKDVDQLAFFRIWGPGLVYYLSLPPPIPLLNSTEQVAALVHAKSGAWVITRAKDVANLKLPSQIRASEPESQWDSASENGSRRVLLRIAGGAPDAR